LFKIQKRFFTYKEVLILLLTEKLGIPDLVSEGMKPKHHITCFMSIKRVQIS